MLGTTLQVFKIQIVRTFEPSNGDWLVGFGNGLTGRLQPDHPDREEIRREAERSLQQQRPVGVLLNGEGRILELSHAHETAVASVREEEQDGRRLAVWFWEYSPVCYLTRDHPEFDRIRATLAEAARTGRRVWLANRMHLVEEESEAWWQILDVRSVR